MWGCRTQSMKITWVRWLYLCKTKDGRGLDINKISMRHLKESRNEN